MKVIHSSIPSVFTYNWKGKEIDRLLMSYITCCQPTVLVLKDFFLSGNKMKATSQRQK